MSSLELVASFFVSGLPETKGSWRALVGGKMKRDNPREKAWSTAVGWTAKAQMIGRQPRGGFLSVKLDFFLPPPVGKKNRRDVDKLTRSILDAMTGIVYVDDEQVYEIHAVKNVTRSGMLGVKVEVRGVPDAYYFNRNHSEE